MTNEPLVAAVAKLANDSYDRGMCDGLTTLRNGVMLMLAHGAKPESVQFCVEMIDLALQAAKEDIDSGKRVV